MPAGDGAPATPWYAASTMPAHGSVSATATADAMNAEAGGGVIDGVPKTALAATISRVVIIWPSTRLS